MQMQTLQNQYLIEDFYIVLAFHTSHSSVLNKSSTALGQRLGKIWSNKPKDERDGCERNTARSSAQFVTSVIVLV